MKYFYIILAIFLLATIIITLIILLNKKEVELQLPEASIWPDITKEGFGYSRTGFKYDKQVDISKFIKHIIKTSDPLYKNLDIFCNDNTKDIEFYFKNSEIQKQFLNNLKFKHFAFYFFLPFGEINKYVIDIPNYNAKITSDNSIIFDKKNISNYNVGINIIPNKLSDYEKTSKEQIIKSLDKITGKTYDDDEIYYWYLALSQDPNLLDKVRNIINSNDNGNKKFTTAFTEIINSETTSFKSIINVFLNVAGELNLNNLETIVNKFPRSSNFSMDSVIQNINQKFYNTGRLPDSYKNYFYSWYTWGTKGIFMNTVNGTYITNDDDEKYISIVFSDNTNYYLFANDPSKNKEENMTLRTVSKKDPIIYNTNMEFISINCIKYNNKLYVKNQAFIKYWYPV